MTANIDQTYQQRILNVLIYIQNNLDGELSLEELAQTAFFSPYHFHRIFSAYTGESIKSYVRRLRLERATRDLLFTELSLVQISERAGYDTQQSFHRAFKEAYLSTPTDFREKKQAVLTPELIQKKYPDAMMPEVSIVKIDPISVAFARHVGSYDNILNVWMLLAGEFGVKQLMSDAIQKISIPYDAKEITPEDKMRYDACIVLSAFPDFKANGKVGVQTIRGGKYAVITHKGPIESIEATYELLFGVWLAQSKYEPDDYPNFMMHRNTPYATKSESLLTDIYLPLK
jgi:AraC family transcriptional regulator